MILNRLFGFSGMIKAQPVTELIMMIVSISLLRGVILRQQAGPATGSTDWPSKV